MKYCSLHRTLDIQSHAIGVDFGIKRKVAHPEILDDGSNDHPGSAAATGTVHQTVATLINNRFTHAGGGVSTILAYGVTIQD